MWVAKGSRAGEDHGMLLLDSSLILPDGVSLEFAGASSEGMCLGKHGMHDSI